MSLKNEKFAGLFICSPGLGVISRKIARALLDLPALISNHHRAWTTADPVDRPAVQIH